MPHPTWGISEFRGRAGLEQLEADWRRLYAQIPLRTSFLAYETCLAYADHLMAPDQLRYLALTDGRQVRAICVLEPRTKRVLGHRIAVWGVPRYHHAPRADVLCPDDEARRELVPALVAHLRRKPEGRYLMVLGPAPASSSLWDGLRRLGRGGYCVDPADSVCVLDCSMPFDELRALLPAKFRTDLNNRQHRLAKLRDVRFVAVRAAHDFDAEFATFLDVEASGWKGDDGTRTAIRFSRQVLAFFRDLATNMRGDADYCEIVALYAEGHCLASQFCTRTGATYSLLKIGYNEAYGQVSPGKLVVAKIVERCCQDPGIEQLDMMSDAPWLRSWRPDTVPLQVAYVAVAPWPGRLIVALLQFHLAYARRFVRWLRGKRAASARNGVGEDSARSAG